jgi:hypothetical protein
LRELVDHHRRSSAPSNWLLTIVIFQGGVQVQVSSVHRRLHQFLHAAALLDPVLRLPESIRRLAGQQGGTGANIQNGIASHYFAVL